MDSRKISEICEERKISIPELAVKIGFSRQGLNKAIFDSKSSMKVDTLVSIAKALDVSVMEFIDDEHFNKLKTEILSQKDEINKLKKDINDLELDNKKWKCAYDTRNNEVDFLTDKYNTLDEYYKEKKEIVKEYKELLKERKLLPESDQPKE
jgi:transcriptional regulator with XRE-family HTH domain